MNKRVIKAVETLDPGFLRVTWQDGASFDLDLLDWLTGSPMLEMLQIPEVFRDVTIEDGGWGLVWVNGVDFCSDALRLRAEEQNAANTKVDA